ncbi:MAG: GNAT family protein [Pseudomonadota bacterium]
MDPITTERLRLRSFTPADAPGLFAYLEHPRASCFLSLRLADLSAAEAEARARSADDTQIAVCLRESDRLIGDLFCMPEPPDTYSVGWNFNADFGGAGFAHEAARALFADLFTQRGARRLYAYVEEDNHASQRLCERLGMRREGLFLQFVSFSTSAQGAPVYENTFQYALLKDEWDGA